MEFDLFTLSSENLTSVCIVSSTLLVLETVDYLASALPYLGANKIVAP